MSNHRRDERKLNYQRERSIGRWQEWMSHKDHANQKLETGIYHLHLRKKDFKFEIAFRIGSVRKKETMLSASGNRSE